MHKLIYKVFIKGHINEIYLKTMEILSHSKLNGSESTVRIRHR